MKKKIFRGIKIIKGWWIEIALGVSFVFIVYYWSSLLETLKRYNVAVPVAFYISCEVVWDLSFLILILSAGRSVWERYKKRYTRCFLLLRKANKEIFGETTELKTRSAWFWFTVNRTIAVIQPSVTMVLIYLSKIPRIISLPIYTFLIFDLVHTLMVIWRWRVRMRTRTRREYIRVREATLSDLDELVEIDQRVWSSEAQATRKEIELRLITSQTNFVCVDEKGKIVGVLYCKLLEDYDFCNPLSWKEIANNGDFTPPRKPRFLYGVGLTVPSGAPRGVSDMLMLRAAQYAISRRLFSVLFGSRLPDYHRYYTEMTLEDYVKAERSGYPLDSELRLYIKKATITLFGRRKSLLRIIRGLENYFPDPRSCDCGALLQFKNPFFKLPFPSLWGKIFWILIKYFYL